MQKKTAKIVGIAIISLILVGFLYLYFFEKCTNWTAIAAIGTTLAVIWAVFSQGILAWLKRPVLEMSEYNQEPPFFRPAPEIDLNTGQQAGIGYYINNQITNTGESLARSSQPVVTGMGTLLHGRWEKEQNWLPLGLYWVYDDPRTEPIEEKNLVPNKQYFFNLGCVSTQYPNRLKLMTIVRPTAQKVEYDPGEYCFEVKVFAEVVKPIIKYFRIRWLGGCSQDYNVTKTRIDISTSDSPPW